MSTPNQPTEETTAPPQLEQPVRDYIGYVKWFDDKKGFGFVRVLTPGDRYEQDFFVYQANICPHRSTYRTLRNSECVVFNLSDEDRPQALEVSGVNGMLFCDSRPPTRGRSGGYGGPSRGGPGGRRPYRTNSAPDGDGGEGGEWSTVSHN
jgi:cold shock CspA family protein